jgi:starch synthase
MPPTFRVALLGAEMTPLAKVGGLGDVMCALSEALARRGHDVTVLLPAYRDLALSELPREVARLEVPFGSAPEHAALLEASLPGRRARVHLVNHLGRARYFDRPGVYDDPASGRGYADNGERFLFFTRACMEVLKRLGGAWDVVHANDHQTAFAACFLRSHYRDEYAFAGTGSLFTIHNLGYQGMHPPALLERAGYAEALVRPGSPFEFWGQLNLMKVGVMFADLVSTVSPRYAREIQNSAEQGFGLEGVLAQRRRDLVGILNGIDTEAWDPRRDPHLPAHYGPEELAGKRDCRAALLARAGWAGNAEHWPVAGVISRLADQKGFDLIRKLADEVMGWELRWVVLGRGDTRYHALFERLAREHPERVHFAAGFDEPLAHLIEAGADLFVMPSRYEPCGLNQMYSMRYGTVPVVRATGGLADTVTEFDPARLHGTGFLFESYEPGALASALGRALDAFHHPEQWRALIANGMAQDFSWDRSASRYEELYAELSSRMLAARHRSFEAVLAGAH